MLPLVPEQMGRWQHEQLPAMRPVDHCAYPFRWSVNARPERQSAPTRIERDLSRQFALEKGRGRIPAGLIHPDGFADSFVNYAIAQQFGESQFRNGISMAMVSPR